MTSRLLVLLSLAALDACDAKPGSPGGATSTAAVAFRPSADTADYPSWARDAVIYEVNVRQYTPQGTFAVFEAHLPRLQRLGIDVLWLMPVQPIGVKARKGTLGRYDSIRDYTAVNPEITEAYGLTLLP